LDFATASDPALRAALAVGLAAAGLTAGLLATVAVLRLRLAARLARERRFAERWQPVFAACAEGVPEDVPRLAPADGFAFLALWVRAQESLRGEVQEHLVRLAARVGADRIAVGYLAGGNARKALLALVAVGHLRLREAMPLAKALLAAPSGVVSLAAAQTLLRIDPQEGLRPLLDQAARREDWPLARLAALLGECDREQLGRAIAEAVDAGLGAWPPDAGVARLLRLHGVAHPEMLRPAVLRALDPPASAEIAAAALEALWNPADAPHARRCIAHEAWFVRLAAAKALGRIGGNEDRERLAGLLTDASWWVRYRAAHALARLPGMTAAELERLGAAARDPFAAQMVAQVGAEMRAA
jgi:HEAT repeat protein